MIGRLANETNYCDFQSIGTSYEVAVTTQLMEIQNRFANDGNEHVIVEKAVKLAKLLSAETVTELVS